MDFDTEALNRIAGVLQVRRGILLAAMRDAGVDTLPSVEDAENWYYFKQDDVPAWVHEAWRRAAPAREAKRRKQKARLAKTRGEKQETSANAWSPKPVPPERPTDMPAPGLRLASKPRQRPLSKPNAPTGAEAEMAAELERRKAREQVRNKHLGLPY